MINSVILILIVACAMLLSALFSGSETGTYQLSRLRLRIGVEDKRLPFIILAKIAGDGPGLLVTILIGTNLALYVITSIVTYILLDKFKAAHTAELLATLVTVPVLFVFCELLPKNIFFYRADTLMPAVAPVLFVFKKLFTWCGIVPLLKMVSRLVARLAGSQARPQAAATAVQSSYIKAILQETREEGFLSPVQTDIINRLAGISRISIKSVMTHLKKAQTVPINSDSAALLKILRKSAFTRLPVYKDTSANITGFINIYDCLSSQERFTRLDDFVKTIRKLPAETLVSDAINVMQTENQKILLVTRPGHAGKEKPIGLVTMKDLVEELLGELAEW